MTLRKVATENSARASAVTSPRFLQRALGKAWNRLEEVGLPLTGRRPAGAASLALSLSFLICKTSALVCRAWDHL